MPIVESDLKIYKSEVMLDEDDGGGRITANVVASKVSNAIFSDIGEVDEAYGDVSIRKVFAKVESLDADTAFGFSVLVAKPPLNPKVHVALFSTGSHTDQRSDAQNRMESYLTKGSVASAFLLNDHYIGQRMIQVARKGDGVSTLEVNSTYVLISGEGTGTEKFQYLRLVEKTSSTVVTIEVNNKEQPITVDTFTISDALRYDFSGNDYTDVYALKNKTTLTGVLKDTRVSDTSNYYGTAPIKNAAVTGDLIVSSSSIFTQLVPSAQTEKPMLDLDVNGYSTSLVAGVNGTVTHTVTSAINTSQGIYLGSPVLPKSLVFTYATKTYRDTGGNIKADGETDAVGTIDYQTGAITWNANVSTSGSATIAFNFTPCGLPNANPHTLLFRVTQANRGYNFVATLLPVPDRKSLRVSYVAQKRTYTLSDDGSGRLSGADTSFGTGTIDYTTGTVLLTCGEQPDVDTGILFSWSNPVDSFDRGDLPVKGAYVDLSFELPLDTGGDPTSFTPNTMTITWLVGGVTKTVVDDGKGNLTGDATGTVKYSTGEVRLYLSTLPLGGTTFSLNTEVSAIEGGVTSVLSPSSEGVVSFTVPDISGISKGSFIGSIPLFAARTGEAATNTADAWYGYLNFVDVPLNSSATSASLVQAENINNIVGTINYTTGLVTLDPTAYLPVYENNYSRSYSYDSLSNGSTSTTSTSGATGSGTQTRTQQTNKWAGYIAA